MNNTESDRQRFAELVNGALEIYGDRPSPRALEIWFWALSRFPFDSVRSAFAAHIQGPDGKFAPKPAHIIEHVERVNPDGRPGADEAWAMLPKSEDLSVVATEEMLAALGIVRDLLASDEVGARMAFRAAYERMVAEARASGVSPRWIFSPGFDRLHRLEALRTGVLANRMSAENALKLLPPEQRDDFCQSVGAHHLLPPPVDPGKALEARQMIAGMVARLAERGHGSTIEGEDGGR